MKYFKYGLDRLIFATSHVDDKYETLRVALLKKKLYLNKSKIGIIKIWIRDWPWYGGQIENHILNVVTVEFLDLWVVWKLHENIVQFVAAAFFYCERNKDFISYRNKRINCFICQKSTKTEDLTNKSCLYLSNSRINYIETECFIYLSMYEMLPQKFKLG